MAIYFKLYLLAAVALATSAETRRKVERMFMSRTMGSDQEPSATGYIYRSDSNGPASYVQLGAGTVNHHLNAYPALKSPISYAPGVVNNPYNLAPIITAQKLPAASYSSSNLYASPVATSYSGFIPSSHLSAGVTALNPSYVNYVVPKINSVPIKEYNSEESDDDDSGDDKNESGQYSSDESSDEDDDSDDFSGTFDYSGDKGKGLSEYAADFEEGYGKLGSDLAFHGNGGGNAGGHHDSHFKKGAGNSYNAAHHSAHGNNGNKGYDSKHGFDKGEQGKYGKDAHEAHYNQGAGHKAGHADAGNHYNHHQADSKAYKAGSFGEKKSHNKGSKTEGFHNVHHKDEFKKDHDFYDNAHKSGHFDKHANDASYHKSADGKHHHGGKHDSAYHHDKHGKQGYNDQGHSVSSDKGHAAKAGHDGFYNHHADFGKNGGHSDGKEYGYSTKH